MNEVPALTKDVLYLRHVDRGQSGAIPRVSHASGTFSIWVSALLKHQVCQDAA